MRRSLLFIPGNNPGMLQNANLFSADGVILDLEDAVALDEKDSARVLVENFLESFDDETIEVMVRINGLDTDYYEEDLDAIVCQRLDSIMVPKAHVEDLYKLDQILTKLENERKINHQIKLVPIVELAESLIEVDEMAGQARVNGVLLGAEDFTKDMEVERTVSGEEIYYARCKVAVACKANKIDAIDTPFTNTQDEEMLRKDSLLARTLGFNAKSCIHPNQILIVNEVFSPSPKAIQYAMRVIEAAKTNSGAFSLDGKMVDKPIIERSEKVIEKAKRFGLL